MAFSAKIEGDELVLPIPINAKPEQSASGKTLVVASTYGNKETDCVVDGKKVVVGVNSNPRAGSAQVLTCGAANASPHRLPVDNRAASLNNR